MALLTDDIQDKLIKLLVDEGLIEKPVIDAAVKRAADINKPLFSLLALNQIGRASCRERV